MTVWHDYNHGHGLPLRNQIVEDETGPADGAPGIVGLIGAVQQVEYRIPADIAAFANRVGALVASRSGAIPEWTLDEVAGNME